jgi:hypothetical protein
MEKDFLFTGRLDCHINEIIGALHPRDLANTNRYGFERSQTTISFNV